MKFLKLALLLVLTCPSIYGQVSSPDQTSNFISYTGKVMSESDGTSVDFASVSVYDKATNTFIAGDVTDLDGIFSLSIASRDIYIEIQFVGFEVLRISDYKIEDFKADLGIIELKEESALLEEVVVTANRSTTEFKTDRRIFNVGSDLTSSGASALEVLNNVPSVNVDIEGSVTLRGSGGVQILLNGKPSVIADEESGALGNITADMIEKIEVITNPSAKYEAEGTSGIINIILKKNEKKAANGSVTVNGGTPANNNIGFSLNKRTDKFNLFTQLGVGYKERIYDAINTNSNLRTEERLNSEGFEARNEGYYNIVLGSDYYFDDKNVVTLSGSFTYETEDQPSFLTFDLENQENSTGWTRSETTTATNPKLQYELQYKREFDDNEEHQLSFSAIGNYFGKDQSSVFEENLLFGEFMLNDQLTSTAFEEGKYTFNLDYTKPYKEKFILETGVQYVDNHVSNDYQVEDFVDGSFQINPGLTNLFEFDQKVLGAYVTQAYEAEDWGVKLGMRLEYTDLATLLTNTNEENNQNFLDLFPSAHTSYKLSERISFQAGYSRRIYRPRLWDLNPFFNIRNNFSIRTGNPMLMPEYTDSYEIGSVFIYDKVSFNVNIYQRVTHDKIERISTFNDNVRTFSPLNVGTANTRGVEVNFKYTPWSNITFNGDLNYNYFRRDGEFNDQQFDFSNDQWSSKLTTKFKLSRKFDFEFTGQHNSRVQTVQGTQSANTFLDFGMRYKLMNGKLVINTSVRDVFASRIRESVVFADDFENYSFRQLGRFITVGVSYGFGKGEAMTYSGGGRRR